MPRRRTELRDYVTGDPIKPGSLFYLVAMERDVDRVFILSEKSLPRVRDRVLVCVPVREAPRPTK